MGGSIIGAGAVFAGLAVALGAFGAHGLKDRLPADLMEVYQTAVQYHFLHALALILVGLFAAGRGDSAPPGAWGAAWAFALGILLFSGSLYALAWTGTKWLGAITPIGGVAFLVGWGLFAWAALRG